MNEKEIYACDEWDYDGRIQERKLTLKPNRLAQFLIIKCQRMDITTPYGKNFQQDQIV